MCYIIRYYIFTPKPRCFCTACCIIGPQFPLYLGLNPSTSHLLLLPCAGIVSSLSRRHRVVLSLSRCHHVSSSSCCSLVVVLSLSCHCLVVISSSSRHRLVVNRRLFVAHYSHCLRRKILKVSPFGPPYHFGTILMIKNT